ncbi:hypothetical protein Sinac_7313 [Singulisphaera acidiphila DSM 18658]|uniref:Uncharacterized protein n=1 Tax=Singulisphaera acidiphila (strain ATCC BAA-1392 / DSM 18658 / VKM B-2454 / MOB10) TaxID=886293 RepID=L0DQU0_SINAD|nr:hypothetical protein Sinac_7313 [Singulisphaera acidiphila DSM 18658]
MSMISKTSRKNRVKLAATFGLLVFIGHECV